MQAYAAVAAGGGRLVDVRTAAEWDYVGVPLVPDGHQVLFVQWQAYPSGALNSQFVAQLRDAGVERGVPVYFICRSGARSIAAAQAATAAGLAPAYNVLDGFEGPHDDAGHRCVAGWKVAGLPWRQG